MSELRSVTIPAALAKRAEEKFGKKFGSLERLVEFVLTELLNDDAVLDEQHERQIIEQRLRDLGYL